MGIEKYFTGFKTFNKDFKSFDLQGQGFSRKEAENLDYLISRRVKGNWIPVITSILTIPLSRKMVKALSVKYGYYLNKKKWGDFIVATAYPGILLLLL